VEETRQIQTFLSIPMRLLTSSTEISTEFVRLMDRYSKYYWSVAWAGSGFDELSKLLLNKHKIREIVVGLHFYQTHPDFIKEFLKNDKVKFYPETSGVFHPKLFVFEDDSNNWEILIGSANFTSSAFQRNVEVVTLLCSTDTDSNIYSSARSFIAKHWNRAELFNQFKFDEYFQKWQAKKLQLDELNQPFVISKPQKSIAKRPIDELDWDEYYTRLREFGSDSLEPRSKMLERIHEIFDTGIAFNKLCHDDRLRIAGLMTKVEDGVDWRLFGSMVPALAFKKAVYANDPNLSAALDAIPLNGPITEKEYFSFIEEFKKLPKKLVQKAPASRLLAMKRPDEFMCIDWKNLPKLNSDFGHQKSFEPDYESYWSKIILRIRGADWYNSVEPIAADPKRIWRTRVAFIDALYYEPA
jgi:HKD family nuclease